MRTGASATPDVENIGTAAAGAFDLSIRDAPGGAPRVQRYAGLAAGGRQPAPEACSPGRSFTIDSAGQVPERDETNNTLACP